MSKDNAKPANDWVALGNAELLKQGYLSPQTVQDVGEMYRRLNLANPNYECPVGEAIGRIKRCEQDLVKLWNDMGNLQKPLVDCQNQIVDLKGQIARRKEPVVALKNQIGRLHDQIAGLQSRDETLSALIVRFNQLQTSVEGVEREDERTAAWEENLCRDFIALIHRVEALEKLDVAAITRRLGALELEKPK